MYTRKPVAALPGILEGSESNGTLGTESSDEEKAITKSVHGQPDPKDCAQINHLDEPSHRLPTRNMDCQKALECPF